MKNELRIGQKVWVKDSRKADNELKEAIIKTVGKKYFHLDIEYLGRFYIDTLRGDAGNYVSTKTVYLSKEMYDNEIEANQLINKIRSRIGQYGNTTIPLETLRAILNLLP